MPTHELRETIQGQVQLDELGFGYFTKRINLPDGQRNQILSIDCYNDNVAPWLSGSDVRGVQVYLSAYPVQRTTEGIYFGQGALAEVGPLAGDDTVLYKETSIYTLNDFVEQQANKIWTNRFPNEALGSTPTTTFYSPHLYLTVIIWNALEEEIDIKYSIYAKIKQTKCSGVESSMGKYAEFLDAQCRLLTQTAVMTPSALVAGNTFPMWKAGGIRPELMISGTTALRYFNRVASNANQDMISRGAFQTAYRESTKMAAFTDAFGDPTVPIPDWIQIMDVSGVTSGIIRAFPPPLKFADNGNTLMF
ncbi:MAG: hypothetical protein [Circular genetic element sp.]|nr:MAG: hypothetical protein [Circular genetic element sp.]